MEVIFKNETRKFLFNFNDVTFHICDKKITFIVPSNNSLLFALKDDLNNQKVAFLRKNEEDYFFCNTIYEEILFRLKKRKRKCNYDKKILGSLKMVGLDANYLKRSPLEISKGEQKKLAIASILAFNPKIFILDEPFTNLDFSSKKKLIKLFRLMKLKYGKTFIISTSDTDVVLALADEVIALKDDKIIFQGNKIDLFTNKKFMKEASIFEPKIIEFTNLVEKLKGINLGYRDDINDLIKDIYRFVK